MIWLGLAHAATLTVPGTHETLPDACSAAQDGDVIEVTEAPTQYGDRCDVKVRLTIRGVGDQPSIPSVEFYSTSGGSVLENVRVVDTLGWPILTNETELVVRDVLVQDSEYGAIGAWDTILTIEDSTFQDNQSTLAGALYGQGTSKIAISNSGFKGNTSAEAGAISVEQGTLKVEGCHFEGNQGDEASVLYSHGADVELIDVGMLANRGAGNLVRADSADQVVFSGVSVIDNEASGQGYIGVQYHSALRIENSWFCGNVPMQGASTALIRSLGGPIEVTRSGFMNHGEGRWWALISAVDFVGVDEDITLVNNTFLDNQNEEGFVFTTQGKLTMTNNLLVSNADAQDDDGEIAYDGTGNVWVDTWAEDVFTSQFTDERTDVTEVDWHADFDRTDCTSLPYLADGSPLTGVGAFDAPVEDTGRAVEPGDRWVHGGCSTTAAVGPWILGLLLLRRRGMLSG